MNKSAKPDAALAVVLSVVAAICSLWQLWEQDIFWQIRAGAFTAENFFPATQELWSYTAKGKEWIDIQWLSNLGFHLVYLSGGVPGLVVLRGALSFALIFLITFLVRQTLKNSEGERSSALLILIPLLFCTLAFRIHLRPDYILMVMTAGMLVMWESPSLASEKKAWLSLPLVWLAANLHAGTTPYLMLITGAYLITQPIKLKTRVPVLVLMPLLFFVTPSSYHIVPFILDAAQYSQGSLITNPDFMSLGGLHFNPRVMGFTGWAWISLMTLTLVGWWVKRQQMLRWPWMIFTATLILLTISGVRLDRSLPYQALFCLPFAIRGLEFLFDKLPALKQGRLASLMGTLGLAAMIYSSLFGYSLYQWGLDLNPRIYPVESARFIAQSKPQGPIYHLPEYGNFMITNLPGYPVFSDTRDLLYHEHYQIMQDSYKRPDKTQELINKFGIQTFWMPVHRISLKKDNQFEDKVKEFYPPADWALVDFDNLAMVLVKRIPEHQHLIANNEYLHLKPHLPPDHYLFGSDRSRETDQIYLREIERCLKHHPQLPHCWAAKSAWTRSEGDKTQAPALFTQLEQLVSQWPNHLALRMEILNYYKILDRKDDIRETEAKIKALIYSPALRQ
ncbi:MAG: hypothetical protein H6624_00100 [Bdellovibrionaceae bacterium]|nr:hypothetical protein [Bdellovibrionales bacterium]MCB9082707.1 hypothetical protein [Pseudobdellovibrionaceae bacterium]